MVAQAEAMISGRPERAKKPLGELHQVDAAGQAILSLLQKVANTTEANNRRAAEIAENLFHHLRVAEDRIGSLQSEVRVYREKSERAEKWLRRIYNEIELIQQPKEKRVRA
jgi:hypothetical protein